jgi:hypothetical protein
MLLLATTSSKLQVVTGSAVANTVMHASWVDNNNSAITPGALHATTASAVTTDLVAAPSASTQRNVGMVVVRNTHASSSNTITIQVTDGTIVVPIWYGVLGPGQYVKMNEFGDIQVFLSNGVPVVPYGTGLLMNYSTAAQGAGFASDTYLTGSNILLPNGLPKVGTKYRCKFDVSKTAAGTATPIIQIRIGTAGTTADTSRCSFTFGAGTAATDVGTFEVTGVFRTVGSGTSAVLQGRCELTNLASTGLASTVKGVQTTSSGFDSTVANSIIGLSVNGGTSAAWTVQLVEAELSGL